MFFPLLTSAALPPPAADFAIVGAKIEVGDGTVLAKGTVVVRGGRIASVAEGESAPAGVEVIPGAGLTVYPGFIDAYSNKGLKIPDAKPNGDAPDSRNSAPATMWHGNRRGIRAELVSAKILDLAGELDTHRKQGITSLYVTPGGGMFAGTGALIDLTTKGDVTKERFASEMGFRNVGGGGYPGTLFGVTATVRQVLADATTASHGEKPSDDPVLAELTPVVKHERPALFNAATARDILRADRIAQEFNFDMIVYGGTEGYRIADLLKAHKTPVILSVGLGSAPSTKATDDGPPEEVLKQRLEDYKVRAANAKKLVDAGIPIAFGGITGFDKFLDGVRKHMAAGLGRDQALKAMTLGAASIFGVENDLGSVAAGKWANLTVMNGDFADEKSKVMVVYVHGDRFEVEKEAK